MVYSSKGHSPAWQVGKEGIGAGVSVCLAGRKQRGYIVSIDKKQREER